MDTNIKIEFKTPKETKFKHVSKKTPKKFFHINSIQFIQNKYLELEKFASLGDFEKIKELLSIVSLKFHPSEIPFILKSFYTAVSNNHWHCVKAIVDFCSYEGPIGKKCRVFSKKDIEFMSVCLEKYIKNYLKTTDEAFQNMDKSLFLTSVCLALRLKPCEWITNFSRSQCFLKLTQDNTSKRSLESFIKAYNVEALKEYFLEAVSHGDLDSLTKFYPVIKEFLYDNSLFFMKAYKIAMKYNQKDCMQYLKNQFLHEFKIDSHVYLSNTGSFLILASWFGRRDVVMSILNSGTTIAEYAFRTAYDCTQDMMIKDHIIEVYEGRFEHLKWATTKPQQTQNG